MFLGGGTPSLLTAAQVAQILATLRSSLGMADLAEISIEMDPGTFDLAKIQGYGAAGINRVSLGSQAFQDRLLAACGRTHQVADIHAAMALVRQAKIENVSLDLISGLPTQTIADWQVSLERAIALAPTHLSAYDLVLEPGTVFGKRYEPGDRPLPTDDAAAQMYRLAQATLTAAGYGHYEVSNYAQPGFQCRHNRVYWERRPYYAFGLGAASFVGNFRLTRPRTTRLYYEWLASVPPAIAAGQTVEQALGDRVSPTDALLETLMLGMRLVEGINLLVLQQQFGPETVEAIVSAVQPFVAQQWVQPLGQSSASKLQFTDPEGFLFSNQVLAALFEAVEQMAPSGGRKSTLTPRLIYAASSD